MKLYCAGALIAVVLMVAAAWAGAPGMLQPADATTPSRTDTPFGGPGEDLPSPQRAADLREEHKQELAGERMLEIGEYTAAELGFRRAIDAIPNSPDAYQGLAESLAGEGRIADAINVYRKAIYGMGISVGGTSGEARTLLGYAVLANETGKWPEAVTIYQKAVETFRVGELPAIEVHFTPGSPNPRLLAAAAHLALGYDATIWSTITRVAQHDRALNQFRQAVKLEPNWDVAAFYYVYGLMEAGKAKGAIPAVNRIFDLNPSSKIRHALKLLYGVTGKVDPVTGRTIIPVTPAPNTGASVPGK